MLYLRFMTYAVEIYAAALYIQTNLSGRIPGGLQWENWLRTSGRGIPIIATGTQLLTYVAPSLLGLAWAFHSVFLESRVGLAQRAALTALWSLAV
jgi:hypothetical protein